jgi:hypothetical protein
MKTSSLNPAHLPFPQVAPDGFGAYRREQRMSTFSSTEFTAKPSARLYYMQCLGL